MSERVYLHINLGSILMTQWEALKFQWWISISIDDEDGQLLTKSDFIRVSRGRHKLQLVFCCDREDDENFQPIVQTWSRDIYVEEQDIHFTANVYAVKQIEFLEGNVEFDLSKNKEGCYIATAVYGSYDCPQVWVLRRFRDDTLGKTHLGRAFIHSYYAISPTLVKWFGNKSAVRKCVKKPLDYFVKKLENKGIECGPYEDKDWRRKK